MSETETDTERFAALPYVLPMAGFLLFTTGEGYLPSNDGQPSAPGIPCCTRPR